MRPASDMGNAFGIRWDLRLWSTRLAILTFVLSVVAMGAHFLPPAIEEWVRNVVFLTPADVKHGMVWQLITYVFVEFSPWNLLFAVYALLAFGSDVEERTGSDGFLAWFFGLALVGALVTMALSFFWTAVAAGSFLGANAVSLGLLVVWVGLHRGAMINFFMLLPIKAEWMVYFALGMLVLYSISYTPAMFVPDFAAFAAAEVATHVHFDLSPRRLYLRWRAWRIEQQLRKRAKNFTVISGGDDHSREDDDAKPKNGYLN